GRFAHSAADLQDGRSGAAEGYREIERSPRIGQRIAFEQLIVCPLLSVGHASLPQHVAADRASRGWMIPLLRRWICHPVVTATCRTAGSDTRRRSFAHPPTA